MAIIIPPTEVETTHVQPDEAMTTTPKKRSRNRRRRGRAQRARSNSGSSSDLTLSSDDGSVTTNGSSSNRKPHTKKRNHKQQQQQLTAEEQQQYLAMDCEMVGVGFEGYRSALARVTIVDWNGQTVYDEYVQPTEPVTDYRTFVSGITEENMSNAMDLQTCRQQVQALLQDKILVGHALKNDLHALHIQHPWQQTRDTAKYEPFMQERWGRDDGVLWPRKLRDLCRERLEWDIQTAGVAHSPYEDALAALRLYQSVRHKWEKVMAYKVQKTAEIERQQAKQ